MDDNNPTPLSAGEDREETLQPCANTLKPDARDGGNRREQVNSPSYARSEAARRLGLKVDAIDRAVEQRLVASFVDPEDDVRIPTEDINALEADVGRYEKIAGWQRVKVRDIATVLGLHEGIVRNRLKEAGLSPSKPYWRQIRDKWELPASWQTFHENLNAQRAEKRAGRQTKSAQKRTARKERRQRQRQREETLRSRLVEAFPTWRDHDRPHQQIMLHVGGPNSGKTHDALEALIEAGSGWYLAPLRLLAFEIFDRLNRRGVLCNLLTGEEHIPVPGATITAATIEMFNPARSGQCVIIDEAQMLADADRGWAWTRAFVEARAPDIHIIGPATAQNLIERMAAAVEIPLDVIPHARLTPIRVADRNWPLEQLPDHTILVAFSRQNVLHLKTLLERLGRSVSVVYGSLPPEVRRKQADRFAYGDSTICVATDAVGMGLNLPADAVCFYEVEKFDGKEERLLTPAEVQQIGGRAGRFGLSTTGLVGATTKRNLQLVSNLFHTQPPQITHARVAPTVDDLELIPGHLAEQLEYWARLESIPDALRATIKTADLSERIELAKMLSAAEVERLGLTAALQLSNAPTRKNTRDYWRYCASAILSNQPIPFPPQPPAEIEDSAGLEYTETCIACADIYLWLAHRREFNAHGPDRETVREARLDWSNRIDEALLRRLDTMRRCPQCGRPLAPTHPHRLCDACFYGRNG